MTKNARRFMEANARSPVVSGASIGDGGKGAYYTLKSGERFRLSKADCEAVGHPRWDVSNA